VPTQTEDSDARVILLDIEGTTTPIEFVYKKLFPYANREVEAFLLKHFRDPDMQPLLAAFAEQYQSDARESQTLPEWSEDKEANRIRSLTSYVRWLIAKDSKCTPLKSLQGKIWEQGYTTGELRGEVYPDVPDAFKRWRRQGREICIYSSGSVLAQQLLFRSCVDGNLTEYISAFFDTQIGAKTESDSYRRIAKSRGCPPQNVLFISDTPKEVEAARTAGMRAKICVRHSADQNATASNEIVHTFAEILPD
jgi:enolase-phosphatase E1